MDDTPLPTGDPLALRALLCIADRPLDAEIHAAARSIDSWQAVLCPLGQARLHGYVARRGGMGCEEHLTPPLLAFDPAAGFAATGGGWYLFKDSLAEMLLDIAEPGEPPIEPPPNGPMLDGHLVLSVAEALAVVRHNRAQIARALAGTVAADAPAAVNRRPDGA